jgi:hypothetical protein
MLLQFDTPSVVLLLEPGDVHPNGICGAAFKSLISSDSIRANKQINNTAFIFYNINCILIQISIHAQII